MTEDIRYNQTELADMLHRAGIRPSVQRISIFSVIANSRLHPSAEDIYKTLAENFPSLSRTTVYNSLHTLTEAGLICRIEAESGNMRYDLAIQAPHSHFICRKCSKIFDMEMPDGLCKTTSGNFLIESVDVYYRGICPYCTEC